MFSHICVPRRSGFLLSSRQRLEKEREAAGAQLHSGIEYKCKTSANKQQQP